MSKSPIFNRQIKILLAQDIKPTIKQCQTNGMNVYRLTGDALHLIAMSIVLITILKNKNNKGFSGKTQLLFAIVYTARYLDLLIGHGSITYNIVMKILFLSLTYTTVYLIYKRYGTENIQNDDFNIKYILVVSLVVSLLINHRYTIQEFFWTLSIYLEAVAILPQFILSTSSGITDFPTSLYLFTLGSYRLCYVVNWYHRFNLEKRFDLILIIPGILQTALCFLTFAITLF